LGENKFREMNEKELMVLVRDVGKMKNGEGIDLIEECLFRLMVEAFLENKKNEIQV
jgi:hypothetical protein